MKNHTNLKEFRDSFFYSPLHWLLYLIGYYWITEAVIYYVELGMAYEFAKDKVLKMTKDEWVVLLPYKKNQERLLHEYEIHKFFWSMGAVAMTAILLFVIYIHR